MTTRSLQELRADARQAASRGDLDRARTSLLGALGHTIAREDEYVAATVDAKNLLSRMGDVRGALTVDWYAGDERSQAPRLGEVPPIDRARTLLAWAERARPDAARGYYQRAADEYESAGQIARAAICREKADDFQGARTLWSRLSHIISSGGGEPYAAGLARFNLARAAKRAGDMPAAHEATVGSVHLLEEAADRYETVGQRERAFDCYQVLLAIGRESGAFEHVLEGYVNLIRILREDNLRYYALQSYEEAVSIAEKQGEVAAAATLAREMGAYARKEGLTAMANFGVLSQARLWREVARASESRGAPPEIAENAMLAAVMAFGEAGQFQKVAELYGEIGQLPLAESRRDHYARAKNRYAGAADLRIDASPLPSHLRHEIGYPDVWHVDLVEWEQKGSAAEACADVILDPAWSEVTRRRATVGRLAALALEDLLAKPGPHDAALVQNLAISVADQLSQVELYVILSPLEHLFRRPEAPVRNAVVRALSKFLFKRSFITLRAGLADSDKSVAEESAKALEMLHFPHAYDPLARIYRESQSPRARVSALRALSKIDSIEAAELLVGVIENDGRDERAAVVDSLRRARGTKFIEVARAQFPRMNPPAQAAVRELLQSRGVAVG